MEDRIKKIKDSLPLIALVPLVIGGFWQIIELASISSSYIRFFSVTQQLADGLLILFIMTMFYLTILLVKSSFRNAYISKISDYDEITIKIIIQHILIMTAVLAVMLYYTGEVIANLPTMINDASKGVINLPQFMFVILIAGMLFVPSRVLFFLIISLIKKITKITINTQSENFKALSTFVVAIAVIACIRFMFEFIPVFHAAYVTPKNLTNLQYVIDKYSKENKIPNKHKLEIIYMNDKYIFIKDSSNVEVLKLDYMFKNEKPSD